MKKKLLYFIALLFFVVNAKAQEFDYDVTAADPAVGSFPSITQGGITLNTTAPVATDGSAVVYKMLNINSNSYDVNLTSSNDIRQVTFFARGSGNTSTATPVVTFGTSESDPNMSTAPAQTATSSAPGVPLTYSFPAGTKYVKMVRNATVRVFRVAAGSSAFTLPLNFLSFEAKPDAFGKTVDLNWKTTNEVNTKNFEIQKRTDATDFVTIGSVKSNNVSGFQNYSFKDLNASAGASYYRILQFDNDGSSSPSEIISVNNSAVASLKVYPNPVAETLNISHVAAANGASFRILSLDGKTLLQGAANANTTSTSIDVSRLSTGAYMLIFDNNASSSSLKFVKK